MIVISCIKLQVMVAFDENKLGKNIYIWKLSKEKYMCYVIVCVVYWEKVPQIDTKSLKTYILY